MATQICPNCKNDSFTWTLDEEETELTNWTCHKCHYQVFENEKDERNCKNCGRNTESKLMERDSEYWWCWNCHIKSEIKTA